jgi:hypothetical protein
MDRIDLDCGRHIEPSLLEPKRHPSRARKEVDPKGTARSAVSLSSRGIHRVAPSVSPDS